MRPVSVVIPSYNGRSLLEKNLPSVVAAAEAARMPVEVVVVDDGSVDRTESFLRDTFPGIRLLVNDRNAGFSAAMNRGIHEAKHEIVLSLNNDIEVPRELFDAPLRWFEDPDVFSVTVNLYDVRSGRTQSVVKVIPYSCWFTEAYLPCGESFPAGKEIPIFFASGGASFYVREKFLRIGGFAPIFHPFYMEDVDLSYRAWKAGWKCLLEPSVTVRHENSSTISTLHRRRKIKFIVERNRTLMMWLNVTDGVLILRYFLCLPISLLLDLLLFRKYRFVGFFRALAYLPRIPALRRERKQWVRRKDREVLARIR